MTFSKQRLYDTTRRVYLYIKDFMTFSPKGT